jgi:hypothetical protein
MTTTAKRGKKEILHAFGLGSDDNYFVFHHHGIDLERKKG